MAIICGMINKMMFSISDKAGCYWVDTLEPCVFTITEDNIDTYNKYAI